MAYGVEIVVEQEEGVYIVAIIGRVDASTTPLVEKRLMDVFQSADRLVLDFTEVEYLSSAGMRLLLSLTKKMDAKEGKFGLFGISEDVMEIIQMAGFERILPLFSSKTEALESL